jgi:hypothetical protein
MKFSKPTYDTIEQVYTVDVQEGIRFESVREDGGFTPPVESFLASKHDDILTMVLESTKGWFSKPLTADYLKPRLQFQLPTTDWKDFEGTVAWKIQKLLISKQSFVFQLAILEMKPMEKLVIDLPGQDEDSIEEDHLSVPLDDSDEVLSVGPTRRRLDKRIVMLARAKAARALYKAEKLTQMYCELYSYDTDWEDEDSSDEETDIEEES